MAGRFAWLSRLFRGDARPVPHAPRSGIVPADSPETASWNRMQDYLQQEQQRQELYNTYDEMDMTDLPATVLDVYADDALSQDPYAKRSVWIESGNPAIEAELNNLIRSLRFNSGVEEIAQARETAKYGDTFERLVYRAGTGIIASYPVHPKFVHRKEDKNGRLLGFQQDGVSNFRDGKGNLSWPWDYVHFRLRGRNRGGLYGTSILYPAIRPWRQLIMTEDYDLLYDISKGPDRNLYLIDTGTADESEARRSVMSFRKAVGYVEHNDPKRKDYDHRFKAVTPVQDAFIGVRKDNATRVEKIQGSPSPPENKRLAYYLNKTLNALRVPRSAFGFGSPEGEPYQSKMKLANQDIRTARAMRRLQAAIFEGYRKYCLFHLLLKSKGANGEIAPEWDWRRPENAFQICGSRISWLEELEMLEFTQTRLQIVQLYAQTAPPELVRAPELLRYLLSFYMQTPDAVLDLVLKTAGEVAAEAQPPPGGEPPPEGEDGRQESLHRKAEALAEALRQRGFRPSRPGEERGYDEMLREGVQEVGEDTVTDDLVEYRTPAVRRRARDVPGFGDPHD